MTSTNKLILLYPTSFISKPEDILVKYNGLNRLELKVTKEVNEIILHPKYIHKWNESDFDFAILQLKDPVIESSNVKFIKVADKSPPPATTVQLTGWGIDKWGGESGTIMLKSTKMTTMSRERCLDMRAGLRFPFFSQMYLCARYPTVSACTV